MIKKSRLILLLALCGVLSLSGCRKKVAETETETQSETVSETETEKQTEKQTETEKETVKTTASANKNTKTTEKTTVKPSTINSGNTTNNTTNNTSNNTAGNTTDSYGTDQCPYCYQQISLAPNGDGTTVYSVHVAQEKAWADTYGYGDTPPTEAPQQQAEQPTTEQQAQNTNDVAQCGYCYQWFTVSDGSYSAHIAAENSTLGLPEGTEYIQCPTCGYSYPKGSLYDNHVCVTE